jgi:hypothetical protein
MPARKRKTPKNVPEKFKYNGFEFIRERVPETKKTSYTGALMRSKLTYEEFQTNYIKKVRAEKRKAGYYTKVKTYDDVPILYISRKKKDQGPSYNPKSKFPKSKLNDVGSAYRAKVKASSLKSSDAKILRLISEAELQDQDIRSYEIDRQMGKNSRTAVRSLEKKGLIRKVASRWHPDKKKMIPEYNITQKGWRKYQDHPDYTPFHLE